MSLRMLSLRRTANHRSPSPRLALAAVLLAVCGVLSCGADHGDATEPPRGAAVITIALPTDPFGPLRRPAVAFDHDQHAKAVKEKGCKSCHLLNERGGVIAKFGRKDDGTDRDALMELYHERCVGCHTERAKAKQETGPLACGKCHVKTTNTASSWRPIRFDYSLHFRHVAAADNQCETCHHSGYDEQKKQFIADPGHEDGCRSCHRSRGKSNSAKMKLSEAAHSQCIGCHRQEVKARPARAEGKDNGPVQCAGCHSAAAQAAIKTLPAKPIKALDREGKPQLTWIHTPGAKSKLVAFDHGFHEREPQSAFCSDCHHATLKKCDSCHELGGEQRGVRVSLGQAFHSSGSKHSCVGCHKARTRQKDCAGCHYSQGHMPGAGSCAVCHVGPVPGPKPPADPANLLPIEAMALPALGPAFPETVTIGVLAELYAPAVVQHQHIVEALFKINGQSRLASRFHGKVDTLCAGCHHHSPVGTRPPPCSSCHSYRTGEGKQAPLDRRALAGSSVDIPDLKAALHRSCIGCHEQMQITLKRKDPNTPCTECHGVAAKEGKK